MQFTDSQAIYLQIAKFIEDKILRKEWVAEERIPSVRDLAVATEVNPNTIARTFDLLQQKEIIYNKRGIGYFVTNEAITIVLKERKAIFAGKELPEFFKNINLLGLSMTEINELYQQYLKENK